jgi:hypothetical protein
MKLSDIVIGFTNSQQKALAYRMAVADADNYAALKALCLSRVVELSSSCVLAVAGNAPHAAVSAIIDDIAAAQEEAEELASNEARRRRAAGHAWSNLRKSLAAIFDNVADSSAAEEAAKALVMDYGRYLAKFISAAIRAKMAFDRYFHRRRSVYFAVNDASLPAMIEGETGARRAWDELLRGTWSSAGALPAE